MHDEIAFCVTANASRETRLICLSSPLLKSRMQQAKSYIFEKVIKLRRMVPMTATVAHYQFLYPWKM